jgi:hypothetical protein
MRRSTNAVQANIAQPLGVGLDEALTRMEEAYLDRVAETLGGRADAQLRHGDRRIRWRR